MKGRENPPKKDQEQENDLEGSGFRAATKLAQVKSRSLTFFFWRGFYVRGHSEP